MSERVYLVDGSGYIFRAFYAVAYLTTKDGFPTNALFGFTKMLTKLLKEPDAKNVVVVFDAGRETFRNELYDKYKANRDECPAELVPQFPYFRTIASALGLPVLELPGFEADDVIATLATKLEKAGCEVVIVSGDKDLMQLVTDHVTIWDTMKDKHIGAPEVFEKFGVPPQKVVDVLALTGDTSDNVPGAKGIGPKTASDLINKFGNIDGVLSSIASIREDATIRNRKKIADELELSADLVRLSRKLVEVHREAPVLMEGDTEGSTIPISLIDNSTLAPRLARKSPDSAKLLDLIERFDFASILEGVPLNVSAEVPSHDVVTIYKEDFNSWADSFLNAQHFTFDLETTSLDVLLAEIVGLAVSWGTGKVFYIPIAHHDSSKPMIELEKVLSLLKIKFSQASATAYAHNLKYDLGVLAENGVEIQSKIFDTMIAAWLISPDKRSYSLEALSKELLGKSSIPYEKVVPVDCDFRDVPIEKAAQYAGEDALYCWLLKEQFEPKLNSLSLLRVFEDIEMPLVPVLSQMERNGVALDVKILTKMSEEISVQLEELRHKIFELAGTEFNMNSPKQLAEILFEKLGISKKGIKKTKTGISTDSSVLEALSAEHELPREILKHRTLFKLKSTYLDTLPAAVSEKTSRLHSRFNQTGTATGRLSSSDPNLQNIPIQTAEGRKIRKAFVAGSGNKLISADYSQIELRVLAEMSGDEKLIAAFRDGVDIHEQTAREILRVPPLLPVSSEARRFGKTMNFGIIYGMSGFRLSKELGISVAEGNSYIEQYFARYPKVKEFFAKLETQALKDGYVATYFGRRRILSDLDVSDRDKGFMLRVAMNAPIQGTAADIVKLAMVVISNSIKNESWPASLVLQIHDELVFEVHEAFASEAIEKIRSAMQGVVQFQTPLKVDVGIGDNWDEAHA